MTLKEQIADDLEDGVVWFDEDEFADWHDINGANVLCILGSMQDVSKKIGRMLGGALYDSSLLIIRAREFARRPNADEPIEIDGTRYRIIDVLDDVGVYMIPYGRYDDAKIRRQIP